MRKICELTGWFTLDVHEEAWNINKTCLPKCAPVAKAICSLNIPPVPPHSPDWAVRLGHMTVLTSKLWAQVTWVTFRPKDGRAGTWPSGCVLSCWDDGGDHELQMLQLRDVKSSCPQSGSLNGCVGHNNTANSCWACTVKKKQAFVC